MAVDTRDERASIILLAEPFGRLWPNADGAVANEDRQHMGLLYRGITLIATTLMAMERGMSRRLHSRMFGRVNRRLRIIQRVPDGDLEVETHHV